MATYFCEEIPPKARFVCRTALFLSNAINILQLVIPAEIPIGDLILLKWEIYSGRR